MKGLLRLYQVVLLISMFLLALTACNVSQRQASTIHSSEEPADLPTVTNLPTSTIKGPSKTPEPVPSATPTQIPTETSTPVPSATITPLATVSEKTVWVLFRRSGDAGMLMPKDYTGYFLPRLVLYTDGQLIRMTDDDGLVEKVLSAPEMCEFLKALKDTGAFETQGNGDLFNEDPCVSS